MVSFPLDLHLHRRPLQHPLEGARLLRIAVEPVRKPRLAILKMLLQVALQLRQPRSAGAEDPRSADRVAQQRIEQVLQRHVLVRRAFASREGQPQGDSSSLVIDRLIPVPSYSKKETPPPWPCAPPLPPCLGDLVSVNARDAHATGMDLQHQIVRHGGSLLKTTSSTWMTNSWVVKSSL